MKGMKGRVMKNSLYVLLVMGLLAGTGIGGYGAQQKTIAPSAAAKTASARVTVTAAAAGRAVTMPMTDDVYVEIRAHELAFMKAALKDKQNLATGSMAQKMELARLVQKKHGEFETIRKKLLAERRVSEQDYAAYESALTGEAVERAKVQLQKAGARDFSVDDKDGFTARVQQMAECAAKRAAELEAKHTYK
jgi:hypothetical protein